MQIILGLGCDRHTSLQTLQEAIAKALEQAGLDITQVQALATIDKKADEAAIVAMAALQTWQLICFSAEQLARVRVPNPSATVARYMGTPAVAEAAALLAASATVDDLLLEKYKYRGADHKHVTVSIVCNKTML